MSKLSLVARPGAARMVLLVALLALAAADADARGGRRGGGRSSSSSSSSSKVDHSESNKDKGTTINIRTSRGSSSSPSSSNSFVGDRFEPITTPGAAGTAPGNRAGLDPEEAARKAALQESYERDQAERAAAIKAAAEKAEADRIAAERAAAAQQAAEERAEAERIAAVQAKKRAQEAAVAADVDRVLQRAKDDYPVLRTPEGAPWLQKIMERQKVLVARGLYPSVAMVEAVADHADDLRPKQKVEAPVLPVRSAAQAQAEQAKAFGGCRWVTPQQWSCK